MFALKAADESIALSEALSLQTNVEIEIESRNCKQILTSKHIGWNLDWPLSQMIVIKCCGIVASRASASNTD